MHTESVFLSSVSMNDELSQTFEVFRWSKWVKSLFMKHSWESVVADKVSNLFDALPKWAGDDDASVFKSVMDWSEIIMKETMEAGACMLFVLLLWLSFSESSIQRCVSSLQAKDSPLMSSNFVRITKELKNKDQYGQVLFSSAVRMVGFFF